MDDALPPTFSRQNALQLIYYLDVSAQPVGLTSYAIAFLPPLGKDLDNTLSLSSTWLYYPGIYLFLGTKVMDEGKLAEQVRAYVAQSGQPIRFLWIANPADAFTSWRTSQLIVNQNNQLAQPATIPFNNYLLKFAATTGISLNSNGDAFQLSIVSGSVFQRASYNFELIAPIELPFYGQQMGSFTFSIKLVGDTTPADVPAFEQLDACLCYFVPDPAAGPRALAALRYPVLSLKIITWRLYATLDPLNCLVRTRSFFNFLAPNQSQGNAFSSAFATVYGSTVQLTPVVHPSSPAGPRLVFQQLLSSTMVDPSGTFYLTFEGTFSMTIPSDTSDVISARMLTGFSGTEYLGFSKGQLNILTFIPDQPAYAPSFEQLAPVTPTTPPLSPLATTSWVTLTPAEQGTIRYFSQPEEAVFYAPATMPASTSWLPYLEIFAGTFPTTPSGLFPMVPYALLSSTLLVKARQLEVQILSPYRRARLATFLIPTEQGPTSGTRLSTTPQGLLLQLDTDLRRWLSLTLAYQGAKQQLKVANVTGGFKAALQSNQVFAVISNPGEFLNCCNLDGSFKLTIDGWELDFSPTHWSQNRSIMIIKYTEQSIEELARDVNTWSWQAAASGWLPGGKIEATQAELLSIINQAKAQPDGELADFYRRVIRDPNWTGVLFLRSTVSAFPSDLQSLVPGIVTEKLYAHHLAADSTPVQFNGSDIILQHSALFGLIDYADSEDLFFDNLDYAYKVLSLKVTFQNSIVTSFNSQIELMINKLFSDFATLEESTRSNNLVLNGYLQGEGEDATFVFLNEGSHIFSLQNSALRRVEVNRVQFLTLPDRDDMPGTVLTLFVLSGSLEFEEFPQFDVFSFGSLSTGESVGQLHFSNLLIHMNFPASQPSNLDFLFDASAMAFDSASSTARPGSLFLHFPLKLAGLVQGPPENTPGDLGYISVKSPLTQSSMFYPWYGLAFELDLGTLGALAGDIGLTVTLLAAWLPAADNKKNRSIYVGLKLPGSMNSRPEIPIEGVLKLNFNGIEFVVRHEQGSEYILHFKNMALRLLSFSFPPGQTDIYLFGDPTGSVSGTLGWYAAYAKNETGATQNAAKLRWRMLSQRGDNYAV